MQPKFRIQVATLITFAFAAMAVTPPVNAFSFDTKTLKKAAGALIFFTALTCFIRLVTKKTQPKRVYPKDNSFQETAWYTFDELLVGQMEKGDRATSVIIDPEKPQELKIEYKKIEARGLTGIIYSSIKPVILPALTLTILFNASFKEVIKSIKGTIDFLQDPEKTIETIINEAWAPPSTSSTQSQSN